MWERDVGRVSEGLLLSSCPVSGVLGGVREGVQVVAGPVVVVGVPRVRVRLVSVNKAVAVGVVIVVDVTVVRGWNLERMWVVLVALRVDCWEELVEDIDADILVLVRQKLAHVGRVGVARLLLVVVASLPESSAPEAVELVLPWVLVEVAEAACSSAVVLVVVGAVGVGVVLGV